MEALLKYLVDKDRAMLLVVNSLHYPGLDTLMFWATDALMWTPAYALVVFLMARERGWVVLQLLLCVAVFIALSDQITSGLMKPLFGRLRPSQDPMLQGMLHLVRGYRGGMYGFPSGHAANSFGVSIVLYRLWGKNHRAGWTLFVWAAFFSYTRIYLGVHYPLDILSGALVGALCAAAVLAAARRWLPRLFVR